RWWGVASSHVSREGESGVAGTEVEAGSESWREFGRTRFDWRCGFLVKEREEPKEQAAAGLVAREHAADIAPVAVGIVAKGTSGGSLRPADIG
ncbi:MAG: hypothetical protein AAFX41_00735, partial [Bacteroidota bacterium]